MNTLIKIIGELVKDKDAQHLIDLKADGAHRLVGTTDEQQLAGEAYFIIENMKQDNSDLDQDTVKQLYDYLKIDHYIITECS
jgi:hypothetical protein